MCNAFYVQAAGMAVNAYQTRQNSKRQQDAAIDGVLADFNALDAKAIQVSENSRQAQGERTIQAARQLGTLNAIVADSGISGRTVDALRQQVAFDESQDIATLRMNQGRALDQVEREERAASIRGRSVINQTKQTSWLGEGINLFGGYLQQQQRDEQARKAASGDLKPQRARDHG